MNSIAFCLDLDCREIMGVALSPASRQGQGESSGGWASFARRRTALIACGRKFVILISEKLVERAFSLFSRFCGGGRIILFGQIQVEGKKLENQALRHFSRCYGDKTQILFVKRDIFGG